MNESARYEAREPLVETRKDLFRSKQFDCQNARDPPRFEVTCLNHIPSTFPTRASSPRGQDLV